MGRDVEQLRLAASAETMRTLGGISKDVLGAARVAAHEFETKDSLEAGTFEVVEIVFAPKPEKPKKD